MKTPKKNQDGSIEDVWCVTCQAHTKWEAALAVGPKSAMACYRCVGCGAMEDMKLMDVMLFGEPSKPQEAS